MQRIALRLNGDDEVRIVEADRMDCEGIYFVLRRGGQVVARFRADELRGWWIEPRNGEGC
jgi:hypothetical protein